MNTHRSTALPRGRLWAGRIFSGLFASLLALDALGKLSRPAAVVAGTIELGYQESVIVPLGIVLFSSTLLYALPRTAVLGAILLTGYLGGAVATHVRVGNPLLTHVLFPVYVGAFLWLGLALRDPRLQDLFAREPGGAARAGETLARRPAP
jgi:ABC-type transport system involved in cytochrome c biogenesis permease component